MDDTQHLRRGHVAPFNPDPRWPAGYLQVLEELGIEERRRPFYAHWVRQFFQRHQGTRHRDLGRVAIESFLQALTNDPAVADWQVAQAREALEVYDEQFRGLGLAPRQTLPGPADKASAPARAEGAVDRMLDGAVRLRWEYVEDIPWTPSGKYPYVVCHVPLEL